MRKRQTVADRRREALYGDTRQPAALRGAPRLSRKDSTVTVKGTGTAKDNHAPETRAMAHTLNLAPIGHSQAGGHAVIGTVARLPRDKFEIERLTSKGEKKGRASKPVEVPLTRTAEDKRLGIVRVNVQKNQFTWVTRIDRTTDLGEAPVPYRKPVTDREAANEGT